MLQYLDLMAVVGERISPGMFEGDCGGPARALTFSDAFVRIAADLADAGPESHPKLRAACEDYGTAYVHDLVCLEASTSLEEAARCHLTVYRGWIDPFVRR